jgi:O-antigen ligase
MVFLQTLRNHPLGIKLNALVAAQTVARRPSLLFSVSAFVLLFSLMLGGGTRGGFLSDAILELCAIAPFLIALSSLLASVRAGNARRGELALTLCSAIALVPLLQLVPLPPAIWTRLPHREEMAAIFKLLGGNTPWLPISVAPSATWLSALSLLPPLAVFLGVIQLSHRERRVMSVVFLGMGIFAAAVGLIQVAQGPSSPLRFFAFTSDLEAVGFFANTNDFAALMYALLPFAAAWATEMALTIGPLRYRQALESRSIAMLMAAFLVIVVLVAADILTRSRAGLALMIVAAFAALALPLADRRRPSRVTPGKLALGAALVLVLLVVQFGLYRVYEKFAADPMQGARPAFARNTIEAAQAYMPFGSGIGTFVSVYPTFERPQDTIADVYANRAHNDWLEMWLEGGIVSVALIVVFLIWFVLRWRRIWSRNSDNIRAIDVLITRASTIVIPLILAHSLVDYPLRTDAMMAVFAFCCALMVEPLKPAYDDGAAPSAVTTARADRPMPRPASSLPVASGGTSRLPGTPPPKAGGRWGEEIDWPEEWRKGKG